MEQIMLSGVESGKLTMNILVDIMMYVSNNNKKVVESVDYYIYIRVYNVLKRIQSDCKNIKLSYNIIKFGIAKNIKDRNQSYGKDNGSFEYSIKVPNKECAIFIENNLKEEFKSLTVNNSYEYVNSMKLANHFGLLYDKKLSIDMKYTNINKHIYYLTSKQLYIKIIFDLHKYYPEQNNNFGILHQIKKENKQVIYTDQKITKNTFTSFCNETTNKQLDILNLYKENNTKLLNFITKNSPELLNNYEIS